MRLLARPLFPCLAFAAFAVTCIPINAQVTGLSFRPVDANYSLALDRIILVSASPNQLHIYNPVAQADQTVALSAAPLNVCVSPDGLHAGVAFSNSISYVDLQAASVTNTYSNVAVGTGQVICGSGYLYVFPSYEGNISSINISTAQVTTNNGINYASGGTFDSADNAIYSTENGISPNSLNRFDVSGGVVGTHTSQPFAYFSLFNICGPLWFSHDGATIYSACGAVYRASSNATQDMRYLGVLPLSTNSVQSLSTSDSLSQIAAIPAISPAAQQPPATLADTAVNLYSSTSFTATGHFATTPFNVNSTSFPAHGRWVFYNSASTALFIITQADSSAGLTLDYAVENVNLTNANSCNASFTSSSVPAIAPGSYETAQIASGEDCTFTAVSNAAWITLTSGYFGSGNTTLTFLVRPNLSSSSRSGTVTLGSSSFTVNQDAAGPPSAETPLSFKPIAAAYDKALDKIVMISSSPNELHIYEPVSQSDQIVSLPYTPLSLGLRPDGLAAAVGYSGNISIIDLQAQTVSQTIAVDQDNGGIALASNGFAYAFPSQINSFATIYSVQLSNGTLTGISDVYDGNIPRIDATGNYIYVSSFEGASKLNISSGPATVVNSLYGTLSGNIWLSEDGSRLINSSGKVYFASTIPAQDLQPDGQLSGATSVDWAADSQVQQQIAVLTDPGSGAPPSNTQMQIYASNGLLLQEQTGMPGFFNNGSSYISHGRYVFWNAAGSKLFAITEADSTSGLLSDYAIYTVSAPESLPGCTYALSPNPLYLPPSYSTLSLYVTSNCSWTASASNESWLYIYSGVNLGNGQVAVTVQTNSGAARSGTITVGNQTVTVNQADSSCTYSLSSASASFPVAAATGSVSLTTGANCPWSVESNSSWATVSSSLSGTGPTIVQYAVASSPSGYRYGSLNIAGTTFSITQTTTQTGSPTLTVSSTSLTFSSRKILTASSAQTVSITNSSSQVINTGNITLSGASPGSFTFWSDCGTSVAPSATCSVNVIFTPLLSGNVSATLNIPINATGTLGTVSLTGAGALTGLFEILSMPTGKVLEVPGASNADGTLIAQNSLNGNEQQQWQFVPTGDGYYFIQNVLTGKVLDVVGGYTSGGTLIQQWDNLGGVNQQWRLVAVDDVHYAIINRNSGLALDVLNGSTANGANIQQWTYLGDQQQLWVLEPVDSYNIINILSTYAIDVPSASTNDGTLVQQWNLNGYRQQQWQLVPVGGRYFAIMNRNSGKVLDVYGGSLNGGALVQQWDYVGGANQQWQIVPLDGTNYEIVNRNSGYALDDVNASTSAGARIQQWPYEGGANQQWLLEAVTYFNIVNENSGEVLDVVNGSTSDGANIQQWPSNGYQQQQWQLVPVNAALSYVLNGSAVIAAPFAIMNNLTGKVLDVSNSSTADGAQIVQNDFIASPSQQWTVTAIGGISGLNLTSYEITNVNSGKVLDMTGGYLYGGALLQQWDYLGGANQKWQFVKVTF